MSSSIELSLRKAAAVAMVLSGFLVTSCRRAELSLADRVARFHSSVEESFKSSRLAACQVTIVNGSVKGGNAPAENEHIRIVAPDQAALQAAQRAVEELIDDQGLGSKRWASPKDGTGYVLYQVSFGKQRVSSVLIMPVTKAASRGIRILPRDEPVELAKVKLPEYFNGNYEISIVIDDLGSDLSAAKALTQLHDNITFSIIPGQRFSRQTAELAKLNGKEVMVHLPLEPEPHERVSLEQKTILTSMSSAEVETIFEEDVDSIPYAVGFNNHMGSKATANRALMTEILALAKLRGLYFIDSRTTAATQAYEIAHELGVRADFRSVFLDDVADVHYTEGQLDVLLKRMLIQGSAIAIGHPFPTTIEALRQRLPEIERRGVKVVFASQIVS